MKITLTISSLSMGGAERVLVLLTKGFLERGNEVAVITLSGSETDFYQLPDKVGRLALNIMGKSKTPIHALWNNLERLLTLRKAICSTHPDVAIAFTSRTNVLTYLSIINTNYPVIATEHHDPSMIVEGYFWAKLRRITYSHIAKVVSVSQGVDRYFDWLPKAKRAVIYNPIATIEDIQTDAITLPEGVNPNKKWVITMGRLVYEKGFDILLSAFKLIADKYLDWQLLILGEGPMRLKLETLIEKLDLNSIVILTGQISNPFPLLNQSKLFVLSSHTEGFGNVLIEAMSCGLPVISTDCPTGPREIIRDGIDGILVPNKDVSALAAAMERLMSDEGERRRLATRAPEVIERFSLEKTIGIWEELLKQVVRDKYNDRFLK